MDRWSLTIGIIGILAFFLAIPMAIIANMLTPKAQRLWAASSEKRARKRIGFLKLEISKIESANVWHMTSDIVLIGLRYIFTCTVIIVSLLLFSIVDDLYLFVHNGFNLQSPFPEEQFLKMGYITFVIAILFLYLNGFWYRKLLLAASILSPVNRQKIIDKLMGELQSLHLRFPGVDNPPPPLPNPSNPAV
jgi:hypothetical protein